MISSTSINIVSSSSKWLEKNKWLQKIGWGRGDAPPPLNPPLIMEKMDKMETIEWHNVLKQMNRKWIENENFSIKTLSRLTLMKESLGMQGH